MRKDSVPQKILNVLKKESRLTINEIFKRTTVPEHRKKYHRICIYRLLEAGKIAKDGKSGSEYLYSLADRAINYLEHLKQLHSIMDKRMDFTQKPTDNEIKEIKYIEETIKNEPFR